MLFHMGNMTSIVSRVYGVKTQAQDTRGFQNKPQGAFHPNMLLVRWEMAARAQSWATAMGIAKAIIVKLPSEPIGWIYHAFAQQQIGHVDEARQTLLAAARKFPNDWRIAYNLACYAAQLGDVAGAWNWFDRALEIGDATIIQACAMEEPSLKPLLQKSESREDAFAA